MSDRTQHALLLLHHHRPAEAEKELRAHLAEHPQDTMAVALLSTAQGAQGQHAAAIATAQQLIAMAPDDPSGYHHLAQARLANKETAAALDPARAAVRLDPNDADNHAMLAFVYHYLNEHNEALAAAERGLALDPEHLTCLNIRSSELAGMKRFAEADAVTAKLLEVDPEDPYTHSNTGWSMLRRGDHGQALIHFREALRREPGMENARRGMVETLKSRYWPYRQWLRYVFWVGNLRPGMQTGFIIGIWILMRMLGSLGDRYPSISFVVLPLVVVYVLFAFSTWVITPLTNLLLRLNRYGRYVLDAQEKRTSALTGLALALVITGGIGFLVNGHSGFVTLAGFGLLMMIPMASMLTSDRSNVRRFRIAAAAVLAAIGIVGVAGAFMGQGVLNPAMTVFGIGAIGYQWITALFVR